MKQIIKTYKPTADAIGKLFPNHIEVILHDLSTGKIAYIVNSFSNRVIGDESLINISKLEGDADSNDVIGPYRKINSDGKELKSVTSLIRDGQGKPSALMCVNFKTEEVDLAINLLSNLTGSIAIQKSAPNKSLLAEDWREQVNILIRLTTDELQTTLVAAKRKHKMAMLKAIDKADIFEIRGSSNYVAEALGISRANLYEILRDARK